MHKTTIYTKFLQRFGVLKPNTPNTVDRVACESLAPIASNQYADFYGYDYGGYYPGPYFGEKNKGNLRLGVEEHPSYYILSQQGWNQFLTNDIVKSIINKMTTQIIGKGLLCEPEVCEDTIRAYGYNITKEQVKELQKQAQTMFRLHAASKRSGHGGMESINTIAARAFRHSLLGDCLCILRRSNNRVTIQLIPGKMIIGQYGNVPKKNTVKYGIEQDTTGRVIAFHVRQDNVLPNQPSSKKGGVRVEAYDRQTGIVRAFLVKSLQYYEEDYRGLSQFAANLERLEQMDRFVGASVANAEEKAKATMWVEHEEYSSGDDPFTPGAAINQRLKPTVIHPDNTETTVETCKKISFTEQKNVHNLPAGAKLKTWERDSLMGFQEFYDPNYDIVAGNVLCPPEVAKSKYNSNYTAGRAAIMDWEETIDIYRHNFLNQFYKNIYAFWFFNMALEPSPNGGFMLNAPGYIDAFNNGNTMVTDAFEKANFRGKNRPAIDPLKEAKAIREQLGDRFKDVPLTTITKAMEHLNNGDFSTNFENLEMEIEQVEQYINEIQNG